MQQTNSSARRHLAMGQLNRQRYARAQTSGDAAEISLWRGDLLTEEVNKSQILRFDPNSPYNSMLRSCSTCR